MLLSTHVLDVSLLQRSSFCDRGPLSQGSFDSDAFSGGVS